MPQWRLDILAKVHNQSMKGRKQRITVLQHANATKKAKTAAKVDQAEFDRLRKKGLSYEQIAARLDVSPPTLRAWRRDNQR